MSKKNVWFEELFKFLVEYYAILSELLNLYLHRHTDTLTVSNCYQNNQLFCVWLKVADKVVIDGSNEYSLFSLFLNISF